MTASLLAAVTLGAVALGVAIRAARRRAASRAGREGLARRLAQTYAAFDGAAPTVPLRAPEGWVAVLPDGLGLALGREPSRARFVPWAGVRSITPAPDGTFHVRVARVGTVEVPGALGRPLWDAFGARSPRPAPATAERARPGRV